MDFMQQSLQQIGIDIENGFEPEYVTIPGKEKTLADLKAAAKDASEIFLASTTRDVQAVSVWDDRTLAAPGPVTQEAMRVWREREPELLAL